MNRILLLCAACIALFTSGCRDSIDELIQKGAFEAAFYYHSGGMPADRFVTITIVINNNGGALKREERSVSDSKKNKEALAQFTVTSTDLKKFYIMLKGKGFFELKTIKTDSPDARTVYLKIKKGTAVFTREESPVVSMATNPDRQKFMTIISEFNAFVKDRLPPGQKRLGEY